MIATISKDFTFSASHQLDGLPADHQCARLHGHNYTLRITISGHVIEPGFVIDYGELAFIKQHVDEQLDHRHLNDVFDFNPTAENMAGWLADWVAIRLRERTNITNITASLSETGKTWATVAAQPSHLPTVHDLDTDRYRWGNEER